MTPHYVYLYYLVEDKRSSPVEKNECNYVEIHRYEENAKGAE
jgi:hypothetical protein